LAAPAALCAPQLSRLLLLTPLSRLLLLTPLSPLLLLLPLPLLSARLGCQWQTSGCCC
jgi:hypothetical protein